MDRGIVSSSGDGSQKDIPGKKFPTVETVYVYCFYFEVHPIEIDGPIREQNNWSWLCKILKKLFDRNIFGVSSDSSDSFLFF